MERKPRIMVDATPILNRFRFRGVGNQTYSMLKQLLKDTSVTWQFIGPGRKSDFIHNLGYNSETEVPAEFEFYSLGNQRNFLQGVLAPVYYHLIMAPVIRGAKPDLFLNFQIEHTIPLNIPSIACLPDIIPYKLNSYSQKSQFANWLKKLNYQWLLNRAKQATQIYTISDYSRDDLIEAGFAENKVKVIPLALSEIFQQAAEQSQWQLDDAQFKRRTFNIYNITSPYICYFGGLEKNKNVTQILNAFSLITDKYPDLRLVIGGGEFKLGWDHKATPQNERAAALMEQAVSLKILHKLIFTGFVEEQHLPLIYHNAECFVHMSVYEGFGLNVLEPQYVGTPVVAAKASTYPEVLGESALLVDPHSPTEIAQAISSIVGSEPEKIKLKTDLITKGRKNVARYSWERSGKELIKLAKKTLIDSIKMKEVEKSAPKQIVKENQLEAPIPTRIEDPKPETKVPEPKNLEAKVPEPNEPEQKRAVILASYFHPFKGGMEKVALDYGKFLIKMGYEVTVLTSDRKDGNIVIKKEEEFEGIKIKRLERKGRNYYFYKLKNLFKELNSIDPDLIYAHGFGFWGHDRVLIRYHLTKLWRRLRKQRSKRLIIINTPHGPFMSKEESGLRQVFKKIFTFWQSLYLPRILDAVLAVNPEQHVWITKNYRIPLRKISLHPPLMPQAPADIEDIIAAKAKKGYVQISCISRFAEYKGFDDILAAFAEINSSVPTKLYFGGASDGYERSLQTLISFSPRKEDITLEVNISDERRDEILRETDIFIFASAWEAFGIVLAEAMAQGAAVLSSNTEGGRFLVRNDQNGNLFPYKDFRKIVDLTNALLNDKEKLHKYQQESVKIVAKFSSDHLYEEFAKFIASL